jgi:hypothetical protein
VARPESLLYLSLVGSPWRHTIAPAIVVAACLPAAPLCAQPPSPVTVTWAAPEDCPDQASVTADVADLLARLPQRAGRGRRVQADGVVATTEEGFELKLRIESDGDVGRRRVAGSSCESLADAAALIIAIAYDPAAAEAATTDPPAPALPPPPEPPPAPVPVPEPIPPPQSTPAVADESDYLVLVGASGLGGFGVMPGTAAGFGLRLGFAIDRWSAVLAADLWLDQQSTVGTGPAGASLAFQSAAVSGCGAFWGPLPALHVEACGRVAIGRMRGEGFGVDAPGSASATWLAMGPGVGLRWQLDEWLHARLETGPQFAVVRPTWRLANVGLLDDPGVVSGRVALGLDVRF